MARAALPPGRVSPEVLMQFMVDRNREVLEEARETLGLRAAALSDKETVRLFYSELSQK